MWAATDRVEIFILTGRGRPHGFPAFGLLKRDIGGISWLIRTSENALNVGSDNLLHVARYNTGGASSARRDNPLHVHIEQ